MKVVPNKILVIIFGLLASNLTFAAPNPPEPVPPPPPGNPIDGNILVLVVVLLVYTFYKLRNIKKASI
ncbi:hypothetical protein [Flavobacterium sp.]|uniref:hypothetical protein n=1 Tax=Flavobacterium sp. TaxID=239 RepID=UPI0037509770